MLCYKKNCDSRSVLLLGSRSVLPASELYLYFNILMILTKYNVIEYILEFPSVQTLR